MLASIEIPPKKPQLSYRTRVWILMVLLVVLMALAVYVGFNFSTT